MTNEQQKLVLMALQESIDSLERIIDFKHSEIDTGIGMKIEASEAHQRIMILLSDARIAPKTNRIPF